MRGSRERGGRREGRGRRGHRGRRGRRAAPALAAALLALVSAACGGEGEDAAPRPLLNADRPRFDGTAALGHVETQVGFGPRVPGAPGHARQLDWMVESLGALAPEVAVDTFRHVTGAGETLELYNVLARFRPEREHRILVLAHWDTRPRSDQAPDPADRDTPVPGANDGASGVAVILELARMLAQSPPPAGVDLLLVDGEDYGPGEGDMYLGAKRYAARLASGDPADSTLRPAPRFGILLDMVGDADPRFPPEGYSVERAPQVVQRVWQLAQRLGYGRFFPTGVEGYVLDDHIPLNDAGIPTVDIIDFAYGPDHAYWHTPLDTPDKVSAGTLQMVGEVVAELLYQGG